MNAAEFRLYSVFEQVYSEGALLLCLNPVGSDPNAMQQLQHVRLFLQTIR